MIHSMTGYAAVERVEDGASYALELRSVNHRYLKLSIRLPDYLQFAEPGIEKLIRSRLNRGSVTCTLRVQSDGETGPCPIDLAALRRYVDQLAKVQAPADIQATIDLGVVATLPGVIRMPDSDEEVRQRQLALVEDLTGQALGSLVEMRQSEGQALREALRACCATVRSRLVEIAKRAPGVIDEYHERLKSRVASLLEAGGFELQEDGLIREVAVFAERCDIAEEVTRIESHLMQFDELCARSEPVGRTLDFLTQELLREANTIASKSNDAAIARDIVEVKTTIDRLKEQVQNVE